VSFDQQLVQKAIGIVEDKISDSNFTVEDLAKELGLSRMQLHRKFKSLIGVSTSNFINSIRIKKAIHMFDEGCDRVHEAMDSVGVTSYAHFNNLFKKEKGVTPQKYIEQIHTLKQKIK
jgi:AraC-like DNA-binding protein